MSPNKSLEEATVEEEKRLSKKEKIVDTGSAISYSLVVGSLLDCATGLRLQGILVSRATSAATDSLTGALYGVWRDKVFKTAKTTEKSGKIKKYLTDLFVFDTFQIPLYAGFVSLASYVSEGHVNIVKVGHGIGYLAMISPFIGPLRGLYMDKIRNLFGMKSALEKADVQKRTEKGTDIKK